MWPFVPCPGSSHQPPQRLQRCHLCVHCVQAQHAEKTEVSHHVPASAASLPPTLSDASKHAGPAPLCLSLLSLCGATDALLLCACVQSVAFMSLHMGSWKPGAKFRSWFLGSACVRVRLHVLVLFAREFALQDHPASDSTARAIKSRHCPGVAFSTAGVTSCFANARLQDGCRCNQHLVAGARSSLGQSG